MAQEQDGTVSAGCFRPERSWLFTAGSTAENPWAGNTELQGNLVYVEIWASVLLDMTDPGKPCGDIFLPSPEGNGRDVVVDGSTAFMTHGTDGVLVFDVSDPANPGKRPVTTPLVPRKRRICQGILYVADGMAGLVILEAVTAREGSADASHRTSQGEREPPPRRLGTWAHSCRKRGRQIDRRRTARDLRAARRGDRRQGHEEE